MNDVADAAALANRRKRAGLHDELLDELGILMVVLIRGGFERGVG